MLNEIVLSGTVVSDIGNELANHIELMKARKDESLFLDIQMDELLYDVKQAVLLKHLFP